MGDKKQNCFGPGYIYIYIYIYVRGPTGPMVYTGWLAPIVFKMKTNTTTMFTTVITNAGLDLRERYVKWVRFT